MVRWMCSITPENKISTVELRNLLQMNTMRECLQNRKLKSCYLERMEESSWTTKHQKYEVGGCLAERRP